MVWVNTFCMFFSLWVAFSKRFRPITRTDFYWNLDSVAINLFAVILHLFG